MNKDENPYLKKRNFIVIAVILLLMLYGLLRFAEMRSKQISSNQNDTGTTDQIGQQLDSYISQDNYLSARRGQYAEKNGAITPWSFPLDFSMRQDFFGSVSGKRNTNQLSFDVLNIGNMLNPDWGVMQQVGRNSFRGTTVGGGTATGRPIFSYDNLNASFMDNLGLASKWQGQVGVRYIFN